MNVGIVKSLTLMIKVSIKAKEAIVQLYPKKHFTLYA